MRLFSQKKMARIAEIFSVLMLKMLQEQVW